MKHQRVSNAPNVPNDRSSGTRAQETEWTSIAQLSEEFGMGKSTLRRYIAERTLASYKIGGHIRLRRRDVEAFLADRRRGK